MFETVKKIEALHKEYKQTTNATLEVLKAEMCKITPMGSDITAIKMNMAREDSVHHIRDIIETKLVKKLAFDEESNYLREKLQESDEEVRSISVQARKLRTQVENFTKDIEKRVKNAEDTMMLVG